MTTGGRIEILHHDSKVLRGNALGDRAQREVYCYLPAGYDGDAATYPVIYFLSGFTGTGRMLLNFDPFSAPLDARLDRLIASGAMPPVICVLPDCFTRLGGSQYCNSGATGRYEDYLIDEIVPFVDATLRTKASRDHRGVIGKSSGGYGALRLGMRHADVFGALGSHAGDAYFAFCYLPDFPKLVMGLERHGGLEGFTRWFEALPKKTHEALEVLNMIAMAACYSPNPKAPMGIDLPVFLPGGEIRTDVWDRWVENDPVHMASRHAEALKSLRCIFIDAGVRDEFNLQLGARILCSRFDALGVKYVHEEFEDGHMGIVYRYERSFALLAAALA